MSLGKQMRIVVIKMCRQHGISGVFQSARVVWYIDCISAEGEDSPNESPGYDYKPSDGETPALEISLSLLPGPLWPRKVELDRVISIGQIEQTVCKQVNDVKLWYIDIYQPLHSGSIWHKVNF